MSDALPEKLKILIVDDDEDDIILIKDNIYEGIRKPRVQVDAVAKFADAMDRLTNGCYDVCLLDYQIGERNGLELIDSIKGAGVSLPIIFFTGKGDEEVAVAALKAGALDYLIKAQLSPELVANSIRHVLELSRKEGERQAALAALQDSEEQYRTLVNNLPAVVFRAYPDWTIDFFDDKAEEIIGYNSEIFNAKKMKWSDVILPQDFEEAKNKFVHALKTNKSYKNEYRIRNQEGKIIWIHARGRIICDQHGRVRYTDGVFFDVTKQKQTEMEREGLISQLQEALAQVLIVQNKMQEMVITDDLTKLFSRRHFFVRLEEEFARAQRYQHHLSCIMLDIDHFKDVNDCYGHQTGDLVLQAIPNIIKNSCRISDVVARYGGEEIVILLPETTSQSAIALAERIREAVEIYETITETGDRIKVTASLGVASFTPGDLEKIINSDRLIKYADEALYRAKAAGRNIVQALATAKD